MGQEAPPGLPTPPPGLEGWVVGGRLRAGVAEKVCINAGSLKKAWGRPGPLLL